MNGAVPERAVIRAMDLVVTSRCNLRCAYCFESARDGRAMPWSVARAALDAVLATPSPRIGIVFFGGEPLLELETIRRAIAHAKARRARRRLGFSLSTNGLLLGPEEARLLARDRVRTQISFDGVPEAQDLRGTGTFARLDALLDAIRATHPAYWSRRVSVATTVVPATIPHLARSIAYFLDKGVAEIRIAPTITPGSGWSDALLGDLERQLALVSEISREHWRRTGRVPVDLLRPRPRPRPPSPGPVPMCPAASGGRFGVDVDGSVVPCGVFARSIRRPPASALGRALGQVDGGFVWDPDLVARVAEMPGRLGTVGVFDDKQDKYSSYGRCGDCRWLHECAVCPASIVLAPRNDDPRRIPDLLCAFNRVWLATRERFPSERPSSPEALRRRRRRLLGRLAGFAERARGRPPRDPDPT